MPRHSVAMMNKGLLVDAAEHAGKAATISIDCLQRFATFANANAAFVRNGRVPDSVLGIEADAVRCTVAEVGPDASVRELPSVAVSNAVSGLP